MGDYQRLEEGIGEWGIWERPGWIGQRLTNQLLLRATGLFAEKRRKMHEDFPLEEGRCGLFEIGVQLGTGKEKDIRYDGDTLQRGK